MYESNTIKIPTAYSRESLPIKEENVATVSDLDAWPHLRGVSLPTATTTDVELLIGQDCPECLVPRIVISGRKGEPYAVRTNLGWTLNGPIGTKSAADFAQVTSAHVSLKKHTEKLTNIDNCRHVPVHVNPADDCSRRMTAADLVQTPLSEPRHQWPGSNAMLSTSDSDPELKVATTLHCNTAPVHPTNKLVTATSEWTIVKQAAAWILLRKDELRKTDNHTTDSIQTTWQKQRELYCCMLKAPYPLTNERLRRCNRAKGTKARYRVKCLIRRHFRGRNVTNPHISPLQGTSV